MTEGPFDWAESLYLPEQQTYTGAHPSNSNYGDGGDEGQTGPVAKATGAPMLIQESEHQAGREGGGPHSAV